MTTRLRNCDTPMTVKRRFFGARVTVRDAPCGRLVLVVIDINPVVLAVGTLQVRWFGLFALAGVGLGVWLSLRALARRRVSRKLALDALAWALPIGILTARLAHVLGYWDLYLTN